MAVIEKYANFDLASGANDGSSEANAWQSWGDIVFAAGERVNFKNTASRTTLGAITQTVAGTNGSPVWLRGYTSTIGDGGRMQITATLSVTGDHTIVESFDILSTAYTGNLLYLNADGCIGCDLIVDQQNASALDQACVRLADSSLFFSKVSHAGQSSNDQLGAILINRGVVYGCYVVGSGFQASILALCTSLRASVISHNVVDANGDLGIGLAAGASLDNPVLVSDNTVYDASDGIYIDDSPNAGDTAMIAIINNVVYTCSAYGINNNDGTDANCFFLAGNAIGNVTTARLNGFQNYEELDGVTLTADPFVNSSGGDFRLNGTTGGGALCRHVAKLTDVDLDGTDDNYRDIGAMQVGRPIRRLTRMIGA